VITPGKLVALKKGIQPVRQKDLPDIAILEEKLKKE
jgi:hypothetical protein